MQCGDSSVFSTEEHYAALLILVSIIHENFRLHCGWPIELPPLCKNVSKITKSNARPYESVPEELWLLFHNVIISQLELGPPVDWLIEWPPLSKNMFKKSQNQTHVLTKVFPKNHLFRHSGHPTNLSGFKLILLGLWFNTIYWQGARKYYQTNSYNFAITLISQHDHLTAGAWAVCDWLIEWPPLSKNMFKKSQNQTHVLTKVFPKNHLFRHSGHPTNLSGFKLILLGFWFNTIYLPMEFTSSISVPMMTYKSKLRHILAQQWAIMFKMYWNHFSLYESSLFLCK